MGLKPVSSALERGSQPLVEPDRILSGLSTKSQGWNDS